MQRPAFLFVCCWGDFFSSALHPQVHLKDCTSHSDVCHTNPKRADPFFSFSSLTTLITVVQILTAVVMVIASRGLRRR